MIKSSVISILNTFSQEEIKHFEDFLNSPFHNKNTKVIQFFNVLKEYHPGFDDEKLTKENLFKELFGNVKYKESYIRNLFSDLNILAEQFLHLIHVTNNFTYEKFVLEEMKSRDLLELIRKKINTFERNVNSDKSRDEIFYENKLFIYSMKSFVTVDKTLTDSFREDQISSTIKLFMICLMSSSFYQLLEEQRVKIKHDYGFLKHSLDFLGHHLPEYKDSPLLLILYYLWLSFFDKNDEEHFRKAKQLFRKHFSVLAREDKKNIYSVIQIYYINKIDSGDNSYSRDLLDILLEMLKFNIISHNKEDIINLNLYRNILIHSFGLKEISIMKKFIRKYSILVDAESRLSISAYSYAHLNFLQGNFDKALEQSNETNYSNLLLTTNENLYFKNDIKKLTLQCLFELNSFESAISLIDAYKHFLNNSKLIKENARKKNMNFLNLINDLIKLKINLDDFKLAKLKIKVLNTKELTCRHWLLEKIAEM